VNGPDERTDREYEEARQRKLDAGETLWPVDYRDGVVPGESCDTR
jgi:hypothetical protein